MLRTSHPESKDHAALHDILAQINRYITDCRNEFEMGVLTVLFSQLQDAVKGYTRYQLDTSSTEKDHADAKLKHELDNFIARAKQLLNSWQPLEKIIDSIQKYKWNYCLVDINLSSLSITDAEIAQLDSARTSCGLSRNSSFTLFNDLGTPKRTSSPLPEDHLVEFTYAMPCMPFDADDSDDDCDEHSGYQIGFPKP